MQKQRRSGRLTLAVAILIIGSYSEGRVFSEATHTVLLSLHGAGIVSRHRLMAEQELVLRAVELKRETEVRVVGEIGQQGEMHTYGVAFLDERLHFWQMDPPAPLAPSWSGVLTLECGGCKRTVELANGDYEYDLCAIHGGLARFCDDCGLLTVWRQAHEVMPAPRVAAGRKAASEKAAVAVEEMEEPQARAEEVVVPLAEAMEGTERRTRVRAKVNFFACVKTDAFGDDIVTCIDMSRGGVSFRSRTLYQQGMAVLIAVPFSPEVRDAPAIFVRGRITNVKEMASVGMWRCEVEFIKG